MLQATCHSRTGGWVDVKDLDRISDLRAETGNVMWSEADVGTLTEQDVALIADEFELHDLATEDAVTKNHRPKLEEYDTHLFLVCYQLDEHQNQLEATQLSCFIGDDYVLVLHHGAERTLSETKSRWSKAGPEVSDRGVAWLVHTLLDVLVDDYGAIADGLEDEVEQLEESALERAPVNLGRRLYSLKQQLSRLRRYALPGSRILDDAINAQGRTIVPPEDVPRFRDVYDHLLRITDQTRNIDDLANAVLDLRRADQSVALSESNRKLTAWAAIVAVPTLVSSIYGMNFELIPRDGQIFGFWFALGLMAGISVLLYFYFKRKEWL